VRWTVSIYGYIKWHADTVIDGVLENGYKKIKKFRVRTTSNSVVSVFNFVSHCAVQPMWRLVDLLKVEGKERTQSTPLVLMQINFSVAKKYYGLDNPRLAI